MSAEIDKYLEEIDKSETHIAHLLSLIVRMQNSWQMLAKTILKLSNNLPLEDRNKVIATATQFENLLQEFREMAETLITDRSNLICAASLLIQWVQKTFEPKK